MHFLHKILVKVSDAVADRELYENEELIDAVRSYAENETDVYYICEQDDDHLDIWLDNDYLSEHYRLMVKKAVLHVSDTAVERLREQVDE